MFGTGRFVESPREYRQVAWAFTFASGVGAVQTVAELGNLPPEPQSPSLGYPVRHEEE